MKVPTMPFIQRKNVPKLCIKQACAAFEIKVNQYNWGKGMHFQDNFEMRAFTNSKALVIFKTVIFGHL